MTQAICLGPNVNRRATNHLLIHWWVMNRRGGGGGEFSRISSINKMCSNHNVHQFFNIHFSLNNQMPKRDGIHSYCENVQFPVHMIDGWNDANYILFFTFFFFNNSHLARQSLANNLSLFAEFPFVSLEVQIEQKWKKLNWVYIFGFGYKCSLSNCIINMKNSIFIISSHVLNAEHGEFFDSTVRVLHPYLCVCVCSLGSQKYFRNLWCYLDAAS